MTGAEQKGARRTKSAPQDSPNTLTKECRISGTLSLYFRLFVHPQKPPQEPRTLIGNTIRLSTHALCGIARERVRTLLRGFAGVYPSDAADIGDARKTPQNVSQTLGGALKAFAFGILHFGIAKSRICGKMTA